MMHRLSGKVLAFIRSQRVARVATVGPRGEPHNVPVCPVATTGRIYFAADVHARKVRNLRLNPHAALVFDAYTENWQKLAGVTIVGRCVILESGVVFNRARLALYRKYKLYRPAAPIEEGESVIVCFTPSSSYSWGL